MISNDFFKSYFQSSPEFLCSDLLVPLFLFSVSVPKIKVLSLSGIGSHLG